MATVKQKSVVTMKLAADAASHAKTDIAVRDVQMTIDEPEVRGGTNTAPSPTETLFGALLGCTNVVSHRIAEGLGVEITDMEIAAEVQFDRRGVMLEEEIAVPFPQVDMTVDLTAKGTDEQIERLKTDLARFCPVSVLMRAGGTKINETWNVTKM